MPACGTVSAHTRGCRCDLCCAARSEYDRNRRAAKGDDIPQCERSAELSYAANREARARQQREARAANPEHVRLVARDWRARTDNGRRYSASRRARVKAVFIEDVDPIVVFDHVVAIANGGEHSYANTQTLCFACNTSKGARPQIFPSACDAGSQDAITASLEKGGRENGW